MSDYNISINQLADFSASSDAKKRSIIKQQLNPSVFKVPRYQLAKARIKKSIELNDIAPINAAIKILEDKKPTTDFQLNDKKVSLEALKKYKKMRLPKILSELDYSVVAVQVKRFMFSGIDIIVAPEIIIKGSLNGKIVYGGIKIHFSKTKPFDFNQAQYVACIIFQYLKKGVAGKDKVLPELCFCLDVFDEKFVPAPDQPDKMNATIEGFCKELKSIWDKTVS
jgi:hypothetical protein